jgi:hypothetical protein
MARRRQTLPSFSFRSNFDWPRHSALCQELGMAHRDSNRTETHRRTEERLMISRRAIVASGLAVPFLAHASAASLTGATPRRNHAAAAYFAADERFAEARESAHAVALRGAATQSVGEDITALYESLDLAWRTLPFAVAGLTTTNALFVIERLAWDRGLRTVYRGTHRHAGDEGFEHDLLGPPTLIRRIEGRAERSWAAELGRALVEWVPEPEERRQVVVAQTLPGAGGATLASWLLMPRNT